ncbi:MAG: hypothetical protein R3E66_22325 [bacterium]
MRKLGCLTGLFVLLSSGSAMADESLKLRQIWEGRVDYFMTGLSFAVDTDSDAKVDRMLLPAVVRVQADVVPPSASLKHVRVYWGGTQTQTGADCVGSQADDQILVSTPDGDALQVKADGCYCSGADSGSYDLWVCHADITALAGSRIDGQWGFDEYEGQVANGTTDTASAALMFVYEAPQLSPRRVALFDGNYVLSEATANFRLDVNVDQMPQGDLTYYVLEGDLGGLGPEGISVDGIPGAAGPTTLSDAVNPLDNPFNRTINTVTPAQTNSVGVDIDRYDISTALTAGDTAVSATYTAGEDKVWLAVNVVGVNLFDPVLSQKSFKSGTLEDLDGNGVASPGDRITYVIHLENSGNERATVTVNDVIPDGLTNFAVLSVGAGTNVSTASELVVSNVVVEVDQAVDIRFQATIGAVTDLTTIANTAAWSQPTEGGLAGSVTSETVEVRVDADGDGIFDTDDNCPDVANAAQVDADANGIGDACEGDTPDTGIVAPDMGLADVGPTVEAYGECRVDATRGGGSACLDDAARPVRTAP